MTSTETYIPLEKSQLNLGYMPLTDALPLIAAQEMGYFRHAGLKVTLQQEVSWANIRDKVIVGHFDAAQMLAPMLLATHLGVGSLKKAMHASLSLALNGNAFTISNALASTLQTNSTMDAQTMGLALARVTNQRKHNKQPKLVFAVVFPFSVHNLLLRDFLARSDIDPDNDIELVVLPPSQMVDHLRLEHIDGFFAGAPWNSVAIQQGVGQCLLPATKLWDRAPDKVLGVTREWADNHPNTLAALRQAIIQGAAWCDQNPQRAAELLEDVLHQPRETLLPALTGEFIYRQGEPAVTIADMLILNPEEATASEQHGVWFLQQMQRWGWIDGQLNTEDIARQCYSTT